MAKAKNKLILLLWLFGLCCCKEKIHSEQNNDNYENRIKIHHLSTIEPLKVTESVFTEPAPFFPSIESLCETFGIAKENCSCKLFAIPNSVEDMCNHPFKNKTETKLVYSSILSIPVGSISLLGSIIGIFGNAAIIGVLLRTCKKISTWKKLIGMLAASNLLFSFNQLLISIHFFWTNKWIYGSFMCKIVDGGRIAGDFLYIGFLLIITMENYVRIVKRSQEFSPKKAKILVGTNFFLAFITTLPMFVIFHVNENDQCVGRWQNNETFTKVYNWIVIICYFFVPVTAITLLILKMKIALNEERKLSNTDILRAHYKVAHKQRTENQRTLKLAVTMLVSFSICILPNRIVWLYFDYSRKFKSIETYKVLVFVALITYAMLVAVNPIVYSICDVKWRRNISKVVIQSLESIKNVIILLLKSRKPNINKTKKKVTNDEKFSTTKKTFAPQLNNLNVIKDRKGRNLSVDQGTHLLPYNGNYLIMSKNENSNLQDDFEGK